MKQKSARVRLLLRCMVPLIVVAAWPWPCWAECIPIAPQSASASSAETGFEASKAIDGDATSIWHTRFTGAPAPAPHELRIDLPAVVQTCGLKYLPRQAGEPNGKPKGYAVDVSTDGATWTVATAGPLLVPLATSTAEITVNWAPKPAKHVRFRIVSSWGTNDRGSAAEVRVLAEGTPPPATTASTIDLGWDATPGATGYRVYFGAAANQITTAQDAGLNTKTTVAGRPDCVPSFYAVKAYNAAGESAAFSNVVTGWPRPRVTAAPVQASPGDEVAVPIVGANFMAGATIIAAPGITVVNVAVVDCTHLTATVRLAAAASVGLSLARVVNPDNVTSLSFALLDVRARVVATVAGLRRTDVERGLP